MNKQLILMSALFLGFGFGPLSAIDGPPNDPKFTPIEEQQFYNKLKDGIEKTGKKVIELEKKVTSENKNFEGELKDEFTKEVDTLEAKNVLYKNFEHTPSIKDPEIREELLEVFDKQTLNEKDMTELKDVVDKEKAKWPAEEKTH